MSSSEREPIINAEGETILTPTNKKGEELQSGGTGSVSSTVLSILCNVVGGGVLALSAALDNASIMVGSFFMVYVALISGTSMVILTRMATKTNAFTYLELWKCAFPSTGESKSWKHWMVEGTILWYTFGICVAYTVIISDTMEPLASKWMSLTGFPRTGIFWVLIASPFLWLLSSVKSLTKLKFSSLLAFLTILYVGVMVVVRYGEQADNGSNIRVASPSPHVMQALPVVAVSFSMHYNIPPLYKELSNRTPRRMTIAVGCSLTIIVCFYLVVGIVGYLAWGTNIQNNGGDLLAHYSDADEAMNVGRLLMLFHFVFVYPLIAIACRRSLNLLVVGGDDNVSTVTRVLESFVIVALSIVLGMYAGGITEVLSFNGSLFGVHIIMTFPAAMYWKIFNSDDNVMSTKEKVMVVVLVLSGVTFSIAGFVSSLLARLS